MEYFGFSSPAIGAGEFAFQPKNTVTHCSADIWKAAALRPPMHTLLIWISLLKAT
jgi:hypothetical protein